MIYQKNQHVLCCICGAMARDTSKERNRFRKRHSEALGVCFVAIHSRKVKGLHDAKSQAHSQTSENPS